MRRNLLIFFFFLLVGKISSQNLLLRPYIGTKKIWAAKIDKNQSNFDNTFNRFDFMQKVSAGISVEYCNKFLSYELGLSAQTGLFSFSTNHTKAGIEKYNRIDFGFLQIQGIINYIFMPQNSNLNNVIKLVPTVAVGIGCGFVPKQSYFDGDKYSSGILINPAYPAEYMNIDFYISRIRTIGLSGIFKIGLSATNAKREIFRLQTFANLGLNQILKGNLTYNHTMNNYNGKLISKGSQVGILLSVPVYLKRFK